MSTERRAGTADGRRTVTQGVESDAPAEAVLAILTDATRIPEWAPGFADAVAREGEDSWRATKEDRDFALRVAVVPGSSTVDYLRELAPGRGLPTGPPTSGWRQRGRDDDPDAAGV